MKLIKLNDDFCVIEKRRDVDRKNNIYYLELNLERLYGTVAQVGDDTIERGFILQAESSTQPEMWAALKDLDRDQTLEKVYEDIVLWLEKIPQIADGTISSQDVPIHMGELNFEGPIVHIVEHINNKVQNLNVQLTDV